MSIDEVDAFLERVGWIENLGDFHPDFLEHIHEMVTIVIGQVRAVIGRELSVHPLKIEEQLSSIAHANFDPVSQEFARSLLPLSERLATYDEHGVDDERDALASIIRDQVSLCCHRLMLQGVRCIPEMAPIFEREYCAPQNLHLNLMVLRLELLRAGL